MHVVESPRNSNVENFAANATLSGCRRKQLAGAKGGDEARVRAPYAQRGGHQRRYEQALTARYEHLSSKSPLPMHTTTASDLQEFRRNPTVREVTRQTARINSTDSSAAWWAQAIQPRPELSRIHQRRAATPRVRRTAAALRRQREQRVRAAPATQQRQKTGLRADSFLKLFET